MQHIIEVLDRSGHLSLTWDPAIPESVERARSEFDVLLKAGYQFFRVLNQDKPTGFAPGDGALVVKRVEAAEVTPVVDYNPLRDPGNRKFRVAKSKTPIRQERTVAMRPMRGG